MYLNSNYNFIIDYLAKKIKNIEDRFNSWLSGKKDYYTMMTISPRELNDRYKLLGRPLNTYCKQNYIDFNFVVDQILQMSLPYSEGTKGDKGVSVEPSVYEPSVHIFKQSDLSKIQNSFPTSLPNSQNSNIAGIMQNMKMENVLGSQNNPFPNTFQSNNLGEYYMIPNKMNLNNIGMPNTNDTKKPNVNESNILYLN